MPRANKQIKEKGHLSNKRVIQGKPLLFRAVFKQAHLRQMVLRVDVIFCFAPATAI